MKHIQHMLGISSVVFTVTLLAMDADNQLASGVLAYDYAQVKQALDNGATINKIAQPESGMTFLDSVITYADFSIKFLAPHKSLQILAIMDLLLEKGADVNAQG